MQEVSQERFIEIPDEVRDSTVSVDPHAHPGGNA